MQLLKQQAAALDTMELCAETSWGPAALPLLPMSMALPLSTEFSGRPGATGELLCFRAMTWSRGVPWVCSPSLPW